MICTTSCIASSTRMPVPMFTSSIMRRMLAGLPVWLP